MFLLEKFFSEFKYIQIYFEYPFFTPFLFFFRNQMDLLASVKKKQARLSASA